MQFSKWVKTQWWIFHPSGKIVPDCWIADLEWPRSKCHCSCSWNVQLPWGGRSQLSPTGYRRNYGAVGCQIRRCQSIQSIGTSEWRSWKLSFVALATNIIDIPSNWTKARLTSSHHSPNSDHNWQLTFYFISFHLSSHRVFCHSCHCILNEEQINLNICLVHIFSWNTKTDSRKKTEHSETNHDYAVNINF